MGVNKEMRQGEQLKSILLVEDDMDLGELLRDCMERDGLQVVWCRDGIEARERLTRGAADGYDLAVLDLMLPGADGLELLRLIRQAGSLPVLMISCRGEETDKIVGLRMGADDYLAKPFGLGEFAARVHAMLRRYLDFGAPQQPNPWLEQRGIRLNTETYEVYVGGREVALTGKEFELLKVFLAQPKRVYSKAQLFRAVWQQEYLYDENTVMVHIRRLRSKIEPEPSQPRYIQTVWGIGYKLGGCGEGEGA
ncbi:two component transcriptional regulator, winged helix family [Paenibacillus mucilaginosus KNP414]|uniref:Two component transcriptional regulator, winged helix family n=2 Tax=Paenibacillus mucilaginosus TaxID=61624 RepID=F8F6N1_PAEMK|nr:two component transcriptional regulator, winged helix family [Paenibacillus mucilaginosus KNP414]